MLEVFHLPPVFSESPLLSKGNQYKGVSKATIQGFSENMQQIYRRTPMPKCDFNKVERNFTEITCQHWFTPVNLLHIFRAAFLKNTSEWLLLEYFLAAMSNSYPKI